MKYIFSVLLFFFILLILLSGITAFSQNVGIGTSTPDARLEINHNSSFQPTIRVIDSANSFAGWLQMTKLGSPRNMNIFGYPSTNAYSASQRMDFGSDSANTIMTIKGNGNVGINRIAPTERLDVNGNINIANGTIKANGVAGQAGQYLSTNTSGQLQWTNKGGFDNVIVFENTGSNTWVIPAGVTKIMIEAWGAGGGGSSLGGGGGGGYFSSIQNTTGISSIYMEIGESGYRGTTSEATNGGNTSVSVGFLTITAFGGFAGHVSISSTVVSGATRINVQNTPGYGGSHSDPTTISSATSRTIGLRGEKGHVKKIDISPVHSPTPVFAGDETQYGGDGGDAGNTIHTGGKGMYKSINSTGIEYADLYTGAGANGANPGGGGGAGYYYLSPSSGYEVIQGGTGGKGRVIIHY
jgi:hypothetical protein